MVQLINLRKLVFLIPVAIIAGCIFVAQSPLFTENPDQLALAITFDLLISTPVIYFLIIRKSNIPNTTVVFVFILGIVVASIILPTEHQFYLSLVKTWFLPLLEVTIITYVIVSIRKAFKKIRQNQESTPDFFTAAKKASESIVPNKALSTAFATELSLFYYGFINWKTRELGELEFSYHKSTSTRMVLGVFFFLIIIEAVAVHLLVQNYSTVAAWILTILSIYGCVQILGILRSLSKRPIAIEKDGIILKYGIMNETRIPFEQIVAIMEQTKDLDKEDGLLFLSPFKDMEGLSVLIEVDRTMDLSGFYGFKKTFTRIALYLDEPKSFIEKLNEKITPTSLSTP